MVDTNYSTLEVAPTNHNDAHLPEVIPAEGHHSEGYLPEVKPIDGKEARIYEDGTGGLEISPVQDPIYPISETDQKAPQSNPSRRKYLLTGGIILVVVILAAVLGGVLGSRKNNNSSSKSESTSSASDGALDNTPTSSTSSTSTRPTSIPTSKPNIAPLNRNIAAVSFVNNAVNATRIYYQDNTGQLWEARKTARDDNWNTHALGFSAKNGSALAAAVSRPGFPLEISLFYADRKSILQDIIYNGSTDSWTSGTISDESYALAANSSISALYNQCGACANTSIIAFQDQNNAVQIGNFTKNGWGLAQLSDIDSYEDSALALQFLSLGGGGPSQINLYHQKANLSMALASWRPSLQRWSQNEQIYAEIPPSAPIAASSSYYKNSIGTSTWMEVLSISDTGILVSTWSGNDNEWLQMFNGPSIMSNVTASASAESFYSVTLTSTGRVFAAVKLENGKDGIQSWAAKDSIVDWTSTGKIDIGTSWDK